MNLFCFSPFRRLYPPLTRYLGLWQGNYKFETGKKGKYTEEEIELLSRKWWEYWKNYWRLRGTRDALPKDFACEVTIPVDKEAPQGNW